MPRAATAAAYRRGVGLAGGQSIWNLWQTKWQWGVGCPGTLAFPFTYHSMNASFPFICHPIRDRNTTEICHPTTRIKENLLEKR